MDFNVSYLILILDGFKIKFCVVDVEYLGFKYNTSKSHEFWYNFKYKKIDRIIIQNSSFYKGQKNSSNLNIIIF